MSFPAPDPPPSLGPYRLGRRLGSGGMGEVFEAWDERLRRHVAVKRLRICGVGSDTAELRRRFLREARAVARLDHPAVVRIHDVLERPDGDWLVMERVAGQSLARLLETTGPLSVELCADLARQLVAGLECAHDQGLVHRDLKTENVMIADDGRAKLVDFGLAVDATADTGPSAAEGRVIGTARAMSPEQVLGRRVDRRADYFSLGVLLYECLTGTKPFAAATVNETLVRVCTHRPPKAESLRPEVPAELSEMIERCFEKDPACRPQDAAEIRRLLARTSISQQLPRAVAAPAEEETLTLEPQLAGIAAELSPTAGRGTSAGATRRAGLLAALVLAVWAVWPGGRQVRSESARSDAVPSDAVPSGAVSSGPLPPPPLAAPPPVFEAPPDGDSEEPPNSLEVLLERALLGRRNLVVVSPDRIADLWLLSQGNLLQSKPERADELYSRLAKEAPRYSLWNNLGTAVLLTGNAETAAEYFAKAVELQPASAIAHLNLADALTLLGRRAESQEHYARVLSLTADRAAGRPWQNFTVRARALARLGRSVEAVEALRQAHHLAPEEPQLAYEASLVYLLLGERAPALANARRALALGIAPAWFRLPWFEELSPALETELNRREPP